jgi:hypothetical protein
MESNIDENIYKKKQLTNNLDKILSQVTFFLRNCERFNLNENELNNLIYTHSIYKNRIVSSISVRMITSGPQFLQQFLYDEIRNCHVKSI